MKVLVVVGQFRIRFKMDRMAYRNGEFPLTDLSRAGWSARSALAAYRDPCTPAGSLSQSPPVFLN